MTEEQAQELSFRVIPSVLIRGTTAKEKGIIIETINTMVSYLYRRGYEVKSYLTGEDYEKQVQRDFPGDTKENSRGN
jgi:hypothetical protein